MHRRLTDDKGAPHSELCVSRGVCQLDAPCSQIDPGAEQGGGQLEADLARAVEHDGWVDAHAAELEEQRGGAWLSTNLAARGVACQVDDLAFHGVAHHGDGLGEFGPRPQVEVVLEGDDGRHVWLA